MLGVVLSLSLVGAGTAGTGAAGAAAPPAGPCAGVVDRTADCPSPTAEKTDVVADPKTAPPPIPGRTDRFMAPTVLPGELAFASIGLALGGGAAVAWSFANTARTDDEELARDVARWSGAGLLVWSGLTAAGAISLWIFDPSTGRMRPKLLEATE